MKKKTIALLLVLMMIFGVTCGGTIAYLTSTASVENTFTVGKVEITLDEALTNEYGVADASVRIPNEEEAYEGKTGNAYKLIPGHTYTKDPIIHVQPDSEACYVFVKVENGISAIEADTTIEAQIAAKSWTRLKDADGKDVANVYYKEQAAIAKDADAVDLAVFDSFTLKSDATVADYATAKIIVTGYAVQADGMNGAYDAWDKAGFGK